MSAMPMVAHDAEEPEVYNTTALQADITLKHFILPVVALVIVLGNGLLTYVLITKRPTLTTHSLMNYFVVALALSDFFIGCPTIPLMLLAERHLLASQYTCLAAMCFDVCQTTASCSLLIAVGLERYVALTNPFKYHDLVTRQRAFLGIATCWLLAAMVGTLPLFGWNAVGTNSDLRQCRFTTVFRGSYIGFLFLGIHVPLWILMIFLYGRIMYVIRTQIGRRCSLTSGPLTADNPCAHCDRWRRNTKVFRVLTVLVCFYLVCWIPISTYYAFIYRGFRIDILTSANLKDAMPSWVYPLVVSLPYTNSAINPFLYGYGNKGVRLSILQLQPILYLSKFKPTFRDTMSNIDPELRVRPASRDYSHRL